MANIDGLPVNSAVTHAEFISRTEDSSTIGKVALNNTDPVSGSTVANTQRAINKAFEGVGAASESDANVNNYANNNYVADGDNRKVAVEKLDAQLFTTQTQLNAVDAANSQDVTVLPVGTNPNANGITVGANQVVNLEPANATNPGVLTSGAQTIGGNKTFANDVAVTGTLGVTGLSTLASLSVTGNTTLNGDLTVNGTTTTVNSTTIDAVDPNVTINKNGNNASSEGSGLTIDRTGTKGSLIYANALPSRFKAGDLGSEIELVNLSSTQTLTNKTLTSPVINTPTGITKTDVGLANVTNDAQLKRSANDFNTFTEKTTLVSDDLFLIEDSEAAGVKKYVKRSNVGGGSGSGGTGKNFISNPDAEASASTTGWFVDSFVAGAKPSGTLQSIGTGLTFTTIASGQLDGIRSFEYAKDAANRQGRVVYANITIQPAYFAKVLKISFDYMLGSGTFAAKNGSTPSDVIVYIQDVTNGTFIEPSNISLLSNSTSLADKFEATFQTSSNGTSYRLLLYVGSTSASAYTLKLDNVSVSPQIYVYGTPRTDFRLQATTPVITGSGGGTLVAGTGGGAINQVEVATDGDEVIARYTFRRGTTGFTDVSGALLIPFPVGYAPVNTLAGYSVLGYGDITNTGTAGPVARITARLYTYTEFILSISDTLNLSVGGAHASNTNVMSFYIRYKAQGLSSSVQMSDGYDARKISIKQTGSAASTTANNIIVFPTVEYTDGLTINSGRVRIDSAGDYDLESYIGSAASIDYYIWVNGVSRELLLFSDVSGRGQGSTSLKLNAGDLVDLRPGGTTGVLSAYSKFIIKKQQGPQTIAASEKVSFSVWHNSGQSLPAGAGVTMIYNQKISDSHNIYNTANGTFKLPYPGKARLSVRMLSATVTPGGTFYSQIAIIKNGTALGTKIVGQYHPNAGATTYTIGQGPFQIEGNADDVFLVQAFSGVTTSTYTGSDASFQNYLDLEMI